MTFPRAKFLLVILATWLLCAACAAPALAPAAQSAAQSPSQVLAEQRRRMVEEQIRARGVRDPRVLRAMAAVPRHRFVPAEVIPQAYADQALPIDSGQTISQPYIVAYMTEALKLSEGDKVLEIGTGSGYQTAILAELVHEVYSIEIIPQLSIRARSILDELGYDNVQFRTGDGYAGWPEAAPFDVIIVTAAPEHVPQPLIDQLAVGGRMVIPVGRGVQQLLLISRTSEGVVEQRLMPVRFVPLVRSK